MTIAELQVTATVGGVFLRLVLLDKCAGATYKEKLHQFLPVLRTVTTFESLNAADEILVFFGKLAFSPNCLI